MSSSLRVARILGIEVRAHVTFLLILSLVAVDALAAHSREAGFGLLLIVALFVCVVLHELAHSLVARSFGAHVIEIVLLPIGGVSRMTREPTRPLHEFLIAIAGPLTNLALGVLIVFWMRLTPAELSGLNWAELARSPGSRGIGFALLMANAWLAALNLVPAFPMDGGRALRAVLAFFLGRQRATAAATSIAQLLALALAAVGLFTLQNLFLVLIAAFVFFAAGRERQTNRANQILGELAAGEVCNTASETLAPGSDLGDVVDQALRTGQAFFPVVYGTDLVGIVLRDEAIAAAARFGLRANVGHVVRRSLAVCRNDAPLLDVRERLIETGLPVAITDGQRLIGFLGPEDFARISELSARLALAGIRRPRLTPPEASNGARPDLGAEGPGSAP